MIHEFIKTVVSNTLPPDDMETLGERLLKVVSRLNEIGIEAKLHSNPDDWDSVTLGGREYSADTYFLIFADGLMLGYRYGGRKRRNEQREAEPDDNAA